MTRPSRTPRTSAEARRRQVVISAVAEFARHGFKGATTEAIALQVGVTQPYLFRLLPSKHALFLESLTYAFELLGAAEPGDGYDTASAQRQLLRRDEGLLAKLILQGCAAACDDDKVADLMRNRLGPMAARAERREVDLTAELLQPALEAIILPDSRTGPPESATPDHT